MVPEVRLQVGWLHFGGNRWDRPGSRTRGANKKKKKLEEQGFDVRSKRICIVVDWVATDRHGPWTSGFKVFAGLREPVQQ